MTSDENGHTGSIREVMQEIKIINIYIGCAKNKIEKFPSDRRVEEVKDLIREKIVQKDRLIQEASINYQSLKTKISKCDEELASLEKEKRKLEAQLWIEEEISEKARVEALANQISEINGKITSIECDLADDRSILQEFEAQVQLHGGDLPANENTNHNYSRMPGTPDPCPECRSVDSYYEQANSRVTIIRCASCGHTWRA